MFTLKDYFFEEGSSQEGKFLLRLHFLRIFSVQKLLEHSAHPNLFHSCYVSFFLAALRRQESFQSHPVLGIQWVSAELLSWKEASIHTRPVSEPTLASGPACQLSFLRTFSVGATAGDCSESLSQSSETTQSQDDSDLYHWIFLVTSENIAFYDHWSLPSGLFILAKASLHLIHNSQLFSFPTIPWRTLPTTPAP